MTKGALKTGKATIKVTTSKLGAAAKPRGSKTGF